MTEQLNFTYTDIGAMLRILVSIRFEMRHEKRDVVVFHECFDRKHDSCFEDAAAKLFPNSCTLGEKEIDKITDYIYDFMQHNNDCKSEYVKYDKSHDKSWVYFRPDNKLIHAGQGEHAGIISDICMDYFRDFDRINADYLKKFIRDNFEIRSDCSTIEKISEDAPFIAELIELR